MSDEEFARYISGGVAINGHCVTLEVEYATLAIAEVDHEAKIRIAFEPYEGFESRVEKLDSLVEHWVAFSRLAAA
jgi:hypothetical protein